MTGITPHYRSIRQLLQSRSFSIDEYQREYKWERSNVEELITDLLNKFLADYREGDGPSDTEGYGEYFLGSIIVTKRGAKSYLVDGQQRVTSLTLLLIHLYRISKELGLSAVPTLQPLIHSDVRGQAKFNLDIQERVPVLRALFDGEDADATAREESVQTMLARYRDIEEVDLHGELDDGLETFIYWLIENVGLIEIETSSDSYAYAIFETMNDRGKPLSPVDMLKAFLLGSIRDSGDRAHANMTWKKTINDLISWESEPDAERDANFVKAWLRAQYAQSVRERKAGAADKDWELIGNAFHRWARDRAQRLNVGEGGENLHFMTTEMQFFANAYKRILAASRDYTPGLEPVFYNAHNNFTLQSTVLLAPLIVGDDDATVRDKIAATATYLDIWIMRRAANYIRITYSNVAYSMWMLTKDIRRLPLPELVEVLQRKLQEDAEQVSFDGAQARGRSGLKGLAVNQFSHRYIYHLLARVTAYVESESGRPDNFMNLVDRQQSNPWDVEHIWAHRYDQHQEEFETEQDFLEWRNQVAGLVLLPADVNRSYQDRAFQDKVPHYAKQNLYAASLTPAAYEHQPQFSAFVRKSGLPFRPYERFGKEEQRQRQELLEGLVERIWSTSRLDKYR